MKKSLHQSVTCSEALRKAPLILAINRQSSGFRFCVAMVCVILGGEAEDRSVTHQFSQELNGLSLLDVMRKSGWRLAVLAVSCSPSERRGNYQARSSEGERTKARNKKERKGEVFFWFFFGTQRYHLSGLARTMAMFEQWTFWKMELQ